MSTCSEGMTYVPDSLIPSLTDKEQFERQLRKFDANMRAVSGILSNVKVVKSNPGIYARTLLAKENRDKVFQCLPNCLAKVSLKKNKIKWHKPCQAQPNIH